MDRGIPGWTGQSRREGRDSAGGNEDSRDWKGLPEVRNGTQRWAKVFKREDRGAEGGEGRLKEKGLLGRVGDLGTGEDEMERKGLAKMR